MLPEGVVYTILYNTFYKFVNIGRYTLHRFMGLLPFLGIFMVFSTLICSKTCGKIILLLLLIRQTQTEKLKVFTERSPKNC